ncbi:hypothetical protein BJX64DRAFT_262804 [Aspergillus heterothallicus]
MYRSAIQNRFKPRYHPSLLYFGQSAIRPIAQVRHRKSAPALHQPSRPIGSWSRVLIFDI